MPTTSEEGRGQGLGVVKHVVKRNGELHRNTRAVHSAPGQGTAVHIDLPAA